MSPDRPSCLCELTPRILLASSFRMLSCAMSEFPNALAYWLMVSGAGNRSERQYAFPSECWLGAMQHVGTSSWSVSSLSSELLAYIHHQLQMYLPSGHHYLYCGRTQVKFLVGSPTFLLTDTANRHECNLYTPLQSTCSRDNQIILPNAQSDNTIHMCCVLFHQSDASPIWK